MAFSTILAAVKRLAAGALHARNSLYLMIGRIVSFAVAAILSMLALIHGGFWARSVVISVAVHMVFGYIRDKEMHKGSE